MLRPFELEVLRRTCVELHLSKAMHLPEQAITKRFPGAEKEARKALKKLIAKGYIGPHPTRGGMTYQLTESGWDLCREMKRDELL